MRHWTIVIVLVIALTPLGVEARSGGQYGSRAGHAVDNRSYRLPWWAQHSGYWNYGPGALERRDRRRRSAAAKAAFRRDHPCPATGRVIGACPGFVIDHVIALKRGGPDDPANMQWQTVAAARAKDRVE